ncbi:hypothetical protein OIV83_006277 [Microbotryomycetes sp. JL201]|nr:hypothetical protein OIV83_006277 [Microbotryomycetes sp. JL201]
MLGEQGQRSTSAFIADNDHDSEQPAPAHASRLMAPPMSTSLSSDGEDGDEDDDEKLAGTSRRTATATAATAATAPTHWPFSMLKTPRDRRLAKLVVVALVIALAVGLGVGLGRRKHASASASTGNSDSAGGTPSTGSPAGTGITAVGTSKAGVGCNQTSLVNLAKQPSFWSVQVQSPDLVIRPKDWQQYSNCDQLSDAWFTVRLLFQDSSIRLLEDPAQIAPGMYHYQLVAPISKAADGQVSVEAVLELADYPANGMPCNAPACDYSSLLDKGYSWVGATILDDNGNMPTYTNELTPLPTVSTTTALCPRLDHLPGSFNNETGSFTPIGPDGKPCRLLQVDEAVATPAGTPLRWWRFLGDSNMRFFFVWNYPKALGAVQCVKSGRKLHVLCWDNTTAWTWDWWFGEEDVGATADRLQTWLGESLNDYIYERNDDPWDLRWHNDPSLPSTLPTQFVNFTQPAERIYVSMGSHASQLTNEGWVEIMDRITPILQPFKDALVIVLTSATAPSRIPIKYIKDTVMRHNVQINMSNQVVMGYAKRLGVRVLDIFTLTRTTGPHNMIDNVHFPNTVYKIWTRLFFTERFGPGWVP